MRWLDQYRQTQISLARDQLRSGRLVGAQRNNVAGRLQRLQAKQRASRSRGGGLSIGRGKPSTVTGSRDLDKAQRDMRRAMKRMKDKRPGAERDLAKAMKALEAQIGSSRSYRR